MNDEEIKHLIEIEAKEKKTFKSLIKSCRQQLIASPSENVATVANKNFHLIETVKINHNISDVILELREAVFVEFLQQESIFNTYILKHIGQKLSTPKKILDNIISNNLIAEGTTEDLVQSIKTICGEYAGYISPFIYELSLSNTQSRRSRAGKTFEEIIYILYEAFAYPYVSQKSIGRKQFATQGLGKMVDSLLPNIDAFLQRRDKVIIGTMKTTLRERWQEVIEEQSRTNLPNIYLLTVDNDISENKAKQMGNHNVIIVVPKEVKALPHLKKMRNIISFEQYFLIEIPEKLAYWED